jgi:integrase
MLTAQRASEITGLRWDEIGFDRGVISLPGERTKNGRPHEIPMSPTVPALRRSRGRGSWCLAYGAGGSRGLATAKRRSMPS